MAKLALALAVLDFFTFAMTMPLGGAYILKLGGTKFLIGVMMSLHSLCQLIFGPVVGSLSDSMGRKPLILATILLAIISNTLLAVPYLTFYVLSRLLFGACCMQILAKAVVADKTPRDQQSKVYGQLGAFLAMSFIVGPVLSGHIFEREHGPFWISATLVGINVFMLILALMIVEAPKNKKNDKKKSGSVFDDVKATFTNFAKLNWNVFWDIFLIKFMAETAQSMFFSTFGMVMIEQFGCSQKDLGYVLAWLSFVMVLGNVLNGKIKTKYYAEDSNGSTCNATCLPVLTACFFGMWLVPSYWPWTVLLVPLFFARALLDNTWMDMLLARTSENEKGTVIAAFESVVQLAGLGTPMLAGFVGEKYGYQTAQSLAIVPVLIATVVAIYIRSSSPAEKPKVKSS